MNKFLDDLARLGEIQENYLNDYRRDTDLWWYSLPTEDKERAFFYVVSRLVDLELNKDSSYREVMADFNFDYGLGLDSGFMQLHNSIYTDEAIEEIKMVAAKEALDKAVPYKVKMFKG